MPIVSCDLCGNSFYKKPSQIKGGIHNYCSSLCSHNARKSGAIINCYLCGKEVYKQHKAITKSKSKKNFCSRTCTLKWHNFEFKEENHGNWRGGEASYKKILKRSDIKVQCLLCNSIDQRILCVHHIDKNRKNNSIKNLSWLCRNCHHLVHNYKEVSINFNLILQDKEYAKKM